MSPVPSPGLPPLLDGGAAPAPATLAAIVARRRARARRHARAAAGLVVLAGAAGGLAAALGGHPPVTPEAGPARPFAPLAAARLESRPARTGHSLAPTAALAAPTGTALRLGALGVRLQPLLPDGARLVGAAGGARSCGVAAEVEISASGPAVGRLVVAAPGGDATVSALAGTVIGHVPAARYGLVAARVAPGVRSVTLRPTGGAHVPVVLAGRWAVAAWPLGAAAAGGGPGKVTLVARDAAGAPLATVHALVGGAPLVAAHCVRPRHAPAGGG